MTTETQETQEETQTPATPTKRARAPKKSPQQPQLPLAVMMNIDQITLVPQIQNIRDRLDKDTVERYASIASSLINAPLDLYDITTGDMQGYKVLSAGHHRLAGAQLGGLTEVPVVLLQGTLEDAYEHAVRTNRDHGKPLERLERRRLAEYFIGLDRDNDYIMDLLLYGRSGVQTIRNEMKARADLGGSPTNLPNLSNKHYRFLKDAPDSVNLAAAANTHHWSVEILKQAIKLLKSGKTTPAMKTAVLSQAADYFNNVTAVVEPATETHDETYHTQLAAAAAPAPTPHITVVHPAPITAEDSGPSDADLNDPMIAELVLEAEQEGAATPSDGYSSSNIRGSLSNAIGSVRQAMEETFSGQTLDNLSPVDFRALMADLTQLDSLILEFGERITNSRQNPVDQDDGEPTSNDLPF